MENESSLFNDYVIKSILATNQYGIQEVNAIESIVSTNYDWSYYKEIESLLLKKNIEEVLLKEKVTSDKTMFLEVMIFYDQNGKKYAVTVYDSLALEQDPQVIEIFPL